MLNGIRLEPMKAHPLSDKDVIQFGPDEIQVRRMMVPRLALLHPTKIYLEDQGLANFVCYGLFPMKEY